jgi:hypothetical protein
MKSKKERRCLKATIYLYIPYESEMKDEKTTKYYMGRQPGRLQLHDERGNKIGDKMIAFDNLGQMVDKISKQWRKMFKTRKSQNKTTKLIR